MSKGMETNWQARLNELGSRGIPALLLVDFEGQKVRLWDEAEMAANNQLHFQFQSSSANQFPQGYTYPGDLLCGADFVSEQRYREAFEIVQQGLQRGNSFLTNLTMPTEVELSASFAKIYALAAAPYRIWLEEEFVCFSPETFVKIDPMGIISSNPMKGTAEDTPEGRHHLLTSRKEVAEHATIVDLIRNDLSQVASQVRVTRYRYLDGIETPRGGLLQTSSRIAGQLADDWRAQLGTIIARLLPAGSVSGAPKLATVNLIRRAEKRDRGYYCGVAVYFDGQQLDSCVMIRFIEQREDGRQFFQAGGGITALSNWREEYAELKAKVRIPLYELR